VSEVFPKLSQPSTYRACATDLLQDAAAREYWIDLFDSHFDFQLAQAKLISIDSRALEFAREAMTAAMESLRIEPDQFRRLDIIKLDEIRQEILHKYGIVDEFRLIKQRENEAAMASLKDRITELDRMPPVDRLEPLVQGMLAGNLFDLGVKATANAFADKGIAWSDALARVPKRPWFLDELEDACDYWEHVIARKAIIFADNAGADFVLGVMPLARELICRGTDVVIAANEKPVLNDVTVNEVEELLAQAHEIDEVFTSKELRVIPNGHSSPLIDLSRIGHELAREATDADLIVVVGMGRTIESNFDAQMNCFALRVAMVKDPMVAKTVGCELLDAVVRFDRA